MKDIIEETKKLILEEELLCEMSNFTSEETGLPVNI